MLLNKLIDHVAQHSSDSVEALVCCTDVIQAVVVKEDLLDDEDGDSLAELRAGLHDAQAERNDLGSQEEVDHIRAVILH